jgi:hypothetical protein
MGALPGLIRCSGWDPVFLWAEKCGFMSENARKMAENVRIMPEKWLKMSVLAAFF